MIVMFTSNFGFFHHHFTPKACSHYCYVTPVFKGTESSATMSGHSILSDRPVIQLMVSQAILGVRWVIIMCFMALKLKASCRTYNVAQRNKWILRIIVSAYSFASVVRYSRSFY